MMIGVMWRRIGLRGNPAGSMTIGGGGGMSIGVARRGEVHE